MTAAAQFYGLRDRDLEFFLTALQRNSTKNVRGQYLTAAVRSAELGTITPAELDSDLTLLGFSPDAKSWVQLTVATRKLEQLAELYRKSISEAYLLGTLTDDQYIPALEAIGISFADAQAHYAVDSAKRLGKAAQAAAKAAAALANKQQRAGQAAAVASFRTGTIDAAELGAELLALGVDPAIAGYIVALNVQREQGAIAFVYGLELPRRQALVLKEKVAAIEAQFKKQLITDAAAAADLAALKIPDPNAKALLADWAALKTKPTTTGERLPI